jgi:hypothetical protein
MKKVSEVCNLSLEVKMFKELDMGNRKWKPGRIEQWLMKRMAYRRKILTAPRWTEISECR